jgi:hypothetical protein
MYGEMNRRLNETNMKMNEIHKKVQKLDSFVVPFKYGKNKKIWLFKKRWQK